jgi:hypothetical protein
MCRYALEIAAEASCSVRVLWRARSALGDARRLSVERGLDDGGLEPADPDAGCAFISLGLDWSIPDRRLPGRKV